MIYAKLAGLLTLIVGLLATGYHFGEMPYKTKYEALQAQDWQAQAKAQEVAKNAIAAQLVQAQATSKNNADAMVNLANENAQTVADRDATLARVHRLEQLLAAAAARPAAGGGVSQTGGGPPASGASGTSQDAGIETALADAAAECTRNADRLDTLITQIRPQL